MKKSIIFLFCFTWLSGTVGGAIQQHRLDSLLAVVKQMPDQVAKITPMLKAVSLLMEQNPVQARLLAYKALSISRRYRNYELECYALAMAGEIAYRQENYAESISVLDSALEIWSGHQPFQNVELSNIILNRLGVNYFFLQEYDKAIPYYQQAIRQKLDRGDSLGAVSIMGNMGWLYQRSGDLKKALYYLRLNQVWDERYKNYTSLTIGYEIYAEIFNQLNQPDSALVYSKKCLALANYTEYGFYALFYKNFGDAWFRKKNYRKAISYYQKALNIARERNNKQILADVYYNLSQVFERVAEPGKALHAYHLHARWKDSSNVTTKRNQAAYNQMLKEKNRREQQAGVEKVRLTQELQQQAIVRNGIGGVLILSLGFLAVVFRQRNRIAREQKRSEELLLNILPAEIAEELKSKGSAEARQLEQVTVMFADFKGFTRIAEKLTATDLVKEIHETFREFDRIVSKYNIEKIKTIGDCYMCAGGLPLPNQTHAEDVVRAALEIQQLMEERGRLSRALGKESFEARIGIHSGPVVAGIVGIKKFAYDIWGDTVNIASRMESSGEAGKVNISAATWELVKDKFRCTHRGKIEAKNKGEIDMYFVES